MTNEIIQQEMSFVPKGKFPSTRYQGSKQKFIDWLWLSVRDFKFENVLDAFGGTGCFAYKAKQEGKSVTYNDILPFNHIIGQALIENQGEKLSLEDVSDILDLETARIAPTFIADTFHDVYYTDEENLWLDKVSYNIRNIANPIKRAMAYFALFQACIIKRPYNLFHRKNLYVRQKEVKRTFGNKKTWDTPFETHFRKFVNEINLASFNSHTLCKSICEDASGIKGEFDLVYLDPPYIGLSGKNVDYAAFYHFLNGICDYDEWPSKIDYSSPHLRIKCEQSPWCDKTRIKSEFEKTISHYAGADILAISYRSDGIPTIDEISEMLRKHFSKLSIYESRNIRYVLSTSTSQEVLLLARN